MSLVRRLAHPGLLRASQIVIGLVFIAAALPKIGDMKSFAESIHNFRLMPLALENLLAMTLPWIELIIGLLLVLNMKESAPRPFAAPTSATRGGAVLAAVMMVVFTLAVAQAVARGLNFRCGCFGTADGTQVGLQKLVENTVLVLVSVVAALRPRA